MLFLAVFGLSGCQTQESTAIFVAPPEPTLVALAATPTFVTIQAPPTQAPPQTRELSPIITETAPPVATETPLEAAQATATLESTAEVTVLPTSDSPGAEVLEIGEGLRLRSEPGLSASVVTTFAAGTQLWLVGRTSDGGWYQIVTDDETTGWVWGNYLRLFVDSNTIPVTGESLQIPTVPGASNASVVSGVGSNSRQIFERGQTMGNRRDVFSKVGDSLTVATFVLYPIGWGSYNLGGFQHLQSVVNFFSTTNAREGNSYANISLTADNGWTTRDILDPGRARGGTCQAGETPLDCEYRVVQPSVALILVGTNDLSSVPVGEYSSNLQRIVQISIDRGVIPVVSTIPNRSGFDVSPYNQTVMQIAASNGIPLWDYWSAMQILPNTGLSPDGVHPSYPSESDFGLSANFSGDNLQYGYVIRNLTALEVLDAVWRYVLSY